MMDAFDKSVIMVDENGEPWDQYKISSKRDSPFLFGTDSIKNVGNGEVEVRKGKSYLKIGFEVDEEDGRRKRVFKELYVEPHKDHIAPVIIWEKDRNTGKKSFSSHAIPDSLAQAFPHLLSDRHDTLLGQLVVSAYSPKVRDQMPREIIMKGVDGKDRTQPMLEAQTVLLVPRFANKFLTQSPVILGLEALARN